MALDYAAPQYVVMVTDSDALAVEAMIGDITPFIREVTFEESIDMADMIELKIDNAKLPADFPGGDEVRVADTGLLQPGNQIELWAGYPDVMSGVPTGSKLEPLGRGDIVAWTPQFSEDGEEVLTIRAYDRSHKMMLNHSHRAKTIGMPDSVLVSQIGQEYMCFPSKVGITPPRKDPTTGRVKKKGITDWDFIRKLGVMQGFRSKVYYDFGAGYWALQWDKPDYTRFAQPVCELEYGPPTFSLRSFDPDMTMVGTPTDFELLGYDTATGKKVAIKQESTGKKKDPRVKPNTKKKDVQGEWENASTLYFSAFGESFEIKTRRKFADQSAMQAYAEAIFAATQEQWIMGSGTTIGDTRIRLDKVITLSGIGKRLSGDWRIAKARHTFGSQGYVTEFQVHKIDTSSSVLTLDIL